MFMLLQSLVLGVPFLSPAPAAGVYRCEARPHFFSARTPELPGWGRGAAIPEAKEKAIRSCYLANPMAFGRTCRIAGCERDIR